ncbi:FAD-dependent oxidoreductase [Melittangium boletus]|uniref:FAD-dependent oxidoreductase n=1 Tax=Melittangium boletus TaxID=83453 RepID=UPI003DA508D1
MRVIVLGCGVSGLSCGVRLLEAGYPVEIWARELPPHTTSDVAAAIWYPYRAWPQARVNAWAARTLQVLDALADVPDTGVRRVAGVDLVREPAEEPWWGGAVPGLRRATPEERPPGYADGFAFAVPVITMPRYLPWLLGRFEALGGRMTRRAVGSLDEAWAASPWVVNCTGLGARELVDDPTLFPVRGEVLAVAPLGPARFLLDDRDEARGMTYIIPREHDCILGGTAEEGNASLEPDARAARAILERAARLLPEGTRLEVRQHRVGLRPGRPTVRLEAEARGPHHVVHNYGHGGAGVTLSWGCAEEVVALLSRHVGPAENPASSGRTDGS